MPKSKRNKQISLTRTNKHGLEKKKILVYEVRASVENYSNIFLFSVNDMRNSLLKDVRKQWENSRFFFGRNKVMARALGRTPEEEYAQDLSQLSARLKGQCGLLFTNENFKYVLQWFQDHVDIDYARAGNIATETVDLEEGPLVEFSHAMEPHLRGLGMPTTLKKGIIHLIKPYQVCVEGKALTSENARILKLLGHQMAQFKITIECWWSKDGKFQNLKQPTDDTNSATMDVDSDDDISDNNSEMDMAEVDIDEPETKKQKKEMDKSTNGVTSLLINAVEEDLDLIREYDAIVKNGFEGQAKDDKESKKEPGQVEKEVIDLNQGFAKALAESADMKRKHAAAFALEKPKKDEQVGLDPSPIFKRLRSKSNMTPTKKIGKAEGDAVVDEEKEKQCLTTEELNEESEVSDVKLGKLKKSSQQRLSQKIESSPDDKSPIFRSLRNRTVKIRRKK